MNPNTVFKTNKTVGDTHDRESIDVRNYSRVTLYCGNCGLKRYLDTTRIRILTAHKKYRCPSCDLIKWTILEVKLKA
jgi:hypothetical protein